MKELEEKLDEAYRRTAENLPQNAALRVVSNARGAEALDVTGLDELEDPASLVELRARLAAMMPRVDLPELLPEILETTGFADEFTHVGKRITGL